MPAGLPTFRLWPLKHRILTQPPGGNTFLTSTLQFHAKEIRTKNHWGQETPRCHSGTLKCRVWGRHNLAWLVLLCPSPGGFVKHP